MSRARVPIRFVDERSPVSRVIDDHASGKRIVTPLVEYQTRPLEFLTDVLEIPRNRLVWSENPAYRNQNGAFLRACLVCSGQNPTCGLCDGRGVMGWDGTPDPIVRACRVLAGEIVGKRHVAIEAATGTQKTYTAAGLVCWFLGCFEDSLVVTTGSKAEQLKVGLWKEIGVHLPAFRKRFPKVQAVDLKLRMRATVADPLDESGSTLRQEKWSAVGWCAGVDAGAESAVRSQGFHAEHMLIIFEEMPGMDQAIVTALRNTCTAPHNVILGLGNPDHQLDPLHTFSQLPGVEAIRISAFDHPNVVCADDAIVPGATSRAYITEKRAEYGEDGPLYLSRVRGVSPKEAHNALIKYAWLERAAARWDDATDRAKFAKGPIALGVDPAQTENGDRMALARWRGALLESVERVPSTNALTFGQHVWQVMQSESIDPKHVGVDSVGVGSNVVNYLGQVLPPGKYVIRIEGGAEDPVEGAMHAAPGSPREYQNDSNKFLNMRAQAYWQLADDLMHDRVAIPRHEQLWRELMAPTYSTEGGVVRLEKKALIVKKLGRSPDYADAVVYGNWVRPRREAPLPAAGTDTAIAGRDPSVVYVGATPALRTVDGKPPRWIGPESDDYESHRPVDDASGQFSVGWFG